MSAQPQDILFDAYEQWRLHPITGEFMKILEHHKQAFVDKIAAAASTGDEILLRSSASGIRDVDTIIKFMNNYETFKAQIRK